MRRRLTIRGSTGSIGRQALDVVRRYPAASAIVGRSAGKDARAMARQTAEFGSEYLALESSEAGPLEGLTAEVLSGPVSAEQLVRATSDVVLNGIVGFAGLAATVGALQ